MSAWLLDLIYSVFKQHIQCTYKRNIEARSFNNFCSGKVISIIYSVFVCVALVIQHVMRLHHIVICGLLRSTIFFHII